MLWLSTEGNEGLISLRCQVHMTETQPKYSTISKRDKQTLRLIYVSEKKLYNNGPSI